MSGGTRGEVFAGYKMEDQLWVRNNPSALEPKPRWHIFGPKMPRIAPVSPTHISPCGHIIHSDGSEVNRKSDGPRTGLQCNFCLRWIESIILD